MSFYSSVWCYCSLLLFLHIITVEPTFTVVFIALRNGSMVYADQHITGPAMEIAVNKIRLRYPALGDFQAITWRDEAMSTCDGLEGFVVEKAAMFHYGKLNTSRPISAFFGTTCTFADVGLLDLLLSKERNHSRFCQFSERIFLEKKASSARKNHPIILTDTILANIATFKNEKTILEDHFLNRTKDWLLQQVFK